MDNALIYLMICVGASFVASAFAIAAAVLSARISRTEEQQAEWGLPQSPAAEPTTKNRPVHSPARR